MNHLARTRLSFGFPIRFIALIAIFAVSALAREPKVSGTLSTATAGVGEPVEYELTIEGEAIPDNPPVPAVDGLELRGTRQGSELSIVNGDVLRRARITYTLVPTRAGTFTIPALEVKVGGKILSTRPATLTVTPGQPVEAAGDFAFAEVRIPKRSAYVGEAIPIEVRLFLEQTARWDLRQAPTLAGDGFTTQPFGKPGQRDIVLAEKKYTEVTFRTVITPGKAGKLDIGPVPAKLVFSKPTQRNQYELFGFQRMGPAQELDVAAPAVELDVKPLPVEGRPADFSGAIGSFEFSAVGTPGRVNVGEPVEMTLSISGRGNFDRIRAPAMVEPDGWRAYDADERFEASDDVKINGRKVFKLPVAPIVPKTTMPVFAFTFFDPDNGVYKTMKSAPQALTVTGSAPPPAPAAAPAVASASAPVEPKPAVVADILGNLPQLDPVATLGGGISPSVLYGMLLAPVPILAALLAWRSRRRNPDAARVAEMRRDRARLLARIKTGTDRAEVHDAAARVLQLDVALRKLESAADLDLRSVIQSRALDADTVRGVEALFAARTELLYAGNSGGGDEISAGERDRVIETVSAFERSAPR